METGIKGLLQDTFLWIHVTNLLKCLIGMKYTNVRKPLLPFGRGDGERMEREVSLHLLWFNFRIFLPYDGAKVIGIQ